MGQVIAFDPLAKRARREEAAPLAGDARILFFLGVRYVRIEGTSNVTKGAPNENGGDSSRGRKRRRRA